MIDLSVIGFDEFEERERSCPVGLVRLAATACGRRQFRHTSSCRRSEFAEKTKVEEMRERREAATVGERSV